MSLNKVPPVLSTLECLLETESFRIIGCLMVFAHFVLVFFSGLRNLFRGVFVRSAGPLCAAVNTVMQTDGEI